MYLSWSLYTLHLLASQEELPLPIQVCVAVSLLCQALLVPFVESFIVWSVKRYLVGVPFGCSSLTLK